MSVFIFCTGVHEIGQVGVGAGKHRGCPGFVHRGPETLRGFPQTLDDEGPDRGAVRENGQSQRGLQPGGERRT